MEDAHVHCREKRTCREHGEVQKELESPENHAGDAQ
jgi:hypothetical protein